MTKVFKPILTFEYIAMLKIKRLTRSNGKISVFRFAFGASTYVNSEQLLHATREIITV